MTVFALKVFGVQLTDRFLLFFALGLIIGMLAVIAVKVSKK